MCFIHCDLELGRGDAFQSQLPPEFQDRETCVYLVLTPRCRWSNLDINLLSSSPQSQSHRSLSYCKDFEGSLDSRKIKPVTLKWNQHWIFIGRTAAEAEASIRWPPDTKSCLIGKDPDAGKDWRQEEKGTTEDETIGWHRRLNGREFEQTLGDGDGQGSLVCCSPGGRKELDTTEQLNNNETKIN